MERPPRLCELPLALRLGLTALLLVLGGGYAASLSYLWQHHGKRDEEPGLTLTDLRGAYHGVRTEAPLRRAVEGPHGAEFLPDPADRETLRRWLASGRLSEDYDSVELGAGSPAEILDRNCLRCHARGAAEGGEVGQRLPLQFWDDVRKLAFERRIEPVPLEILAASTHAHAQGMALLLLAALGLFLITRWPRGLRHGVFLLGSAGLLLDLCGMWLARPFAAALWLVLAGGAAYGLAFSAAVLGSLVDIWRGRS